MSILEAFFLYLVLFFPSIFAGSGDVSALFSIKQSLLYIFVYNAPALALIWFLLLRDSSFSLKKNSFKEKFLSFIAALFGLLLIGFSTATLNTVYGNIFFQGDSTPKTPNSPFGWFVLAGLCLSTGCLEESFFRVYLAERLKTLGFYRSALISSVFFAFCHLYEGFFGVLNALFAGFFLFFIYHKRKSFESIVLAHSVYNALMYLFSAF
jgi:membrane protease YdiL (CAAX protease family)